MTVLQPDAVARAREEIEARWLPDRIPEGWPPFDIEVSDGCTGVRQVAQHCCIIHDGDYSYGRNWADKILADWRLMLCIIKAGHDQPQRGTMPAWYLLAVGRFVGVLVFGWIPFYKPYKRKSYKRSMKP